MVGRTDRVPPLPGLVALLICAVAAWPAHAADPAAGQAVFKSACGLCHSPQAGRNLTGPSLFGVMGRKTGSEAGFKYSTANQNANITWSPETLDKYLESPRAVIPGTIMTYAGLKDPAKRADLIAYLGTLK
jgi:cytochrome c